MTTPQTPAVPSGTGSLYAKEDFVSGAEVRWCPGCGDYSILSVMQKTLAQFPIPPHQHAFISGIGCSSRLPYYMNTYGFHTIHGRAPSIASGLKIAQPDMTVWVITGDGDGLSIGGNHLIHCMRRNMDLNIILINNEIYGLTKGQYSPTSKKGKVTKSTPEGSIDYPINPLCIAIASEATFIARTVDTDPRHMNVVLAEAMKHKGVSFVEVYQNCIIFNKDTHQPVVGRENREDRALYLEQGKPLIFGKNKDKGIALKGAHLEIVDLAAHPQELERVLVHDAYDPLPSYAYLLTQMTYPDFPVPFGVFRSIAKPTYNDMMRDQIQATIDQRGRGDLKKLLYNDEAWVVEKRETSAIASDRKASDDPQPPRSSWHSEEEAELLKTGVPGKQSKLKKLLMTETVADFLSKVPPIFLSPETSVAEAVRQMHLFQKKGCALVVDSEGKLAGIITIRDFLWRVAGKIQDLEKTPVKDVMTKRPECLEKDAPLSYALHKMAINRIRHVPILENGKPIGVVSTRDVIEYLDPRKKR